MEAALRLLAGAAGVHARERPQVLHPTSRVLVLAGGPITRGPGSVALGIVDGVDMPGIGAKVGGGVVVVMVVVVVVRGGDGSKGTLVCGMV